MAETQDKLAELLRAAWENGVGFGMGSQGPTEAESDAAFATWLEEHTEELAWVSGYASGYALLAVERRACERARGRAAGP